MKRSIFTALAASALLAFSASSADAQAIQAKEQKIQPAKYIFLFIGDGMSLPQRMMAEEFSIKAFNKGLVINSLPQQSYTKSSSANSFITDSAASGTAIACGQKTNNGRIGMDSTGSKKLESVAEIAKKNGRSIGIITSITINHATPASFYAHNVSRDNYYEIGLDLVNSGFDYFGGGGANNNNDRRNRNYKGDIYELAAKAGYTVAHGMGEIKKIDIKKADKLFVRGHNGQLPYTIDRKEDEWVLADYTKQCIDFLMLKKKPFFMMVEGGMIDSHGHRNDAASSLRETIDFDKAVQVAVDFAKQYPNDTLILVTGDHETGGLTLGFANTAYNSYIGLLANQKCSRDTFEGKIRDFARGKEKVEFNDIKPLINENFGLVFDKFNAAREGTLNLTQGEQKRIEEAFNHQFPEGKINNSSQIATTVVSIFDNKASIGWTSGAHTALPVATSALGVNSGLFTSMYDNTDISKRLKEIVNVPVK